MEYPDTITNLTHLETFAKKYGGWHEEVNESLWRKVSSMKKET
jgi:hypothetical protein